MSERFRLPNTFKWFANGGLDYIKQLDQQFSILLRPISEIIEELRLENRIASLIFP
jgi:hypothetical protein